MRQRTASSSSQRDAMQPETPTKTRSQPEALEAPDAPIKRARTDTYIKIRYMKRYIFNQYRDDTVDLTVEHTNITCFVRVIDDLEWRLPTRCTSELDYIIETGEMPVRIFNEIDSIGFKEVTRQNDCHDKDVSIWFVTKVN